MRAASAPLPMESQPATDAGSLRVQWDSTVKLPTENDARVKRASAKEWTPRRGFFTSLGAVVGAASAIDYMERLDRRSAAPTWRAALYALGGASLGGMIGSAFSWAYPYSALAAGGAFAYHVLRDNPLPAAWRPGRVAEPEPGRDKQ